MNEQKRLAIHYELSIEGVKHFIHEHGIKRNDIFFVKKSKDSELVLIAFLTDADNKEFPGLGIHPKALEKAQAIADKYKMVDKKGEQV